MSLLIALIPTLTVFLPVFISHVVSFVFNALSWLVFSIVVPLLVLVYGGLMLSVAVQADSEPWVPISILLGLVIATALAFFLGRLLLRLYKKIMEPMHDGHDLNAVYGVLNIFFNILCAYIPSLFIVGIVYSASVSGGAISSPGEVPVLEDEQVRELLLYTSPLAVLWGVASATIFRKWFRKMWSWVEDNQYIPTYVRIAR